MLRRTLRSFRTVVSGIGSTRPLVIPLAALVVALAWSSCGPADAVDGQIGPTGGELCIADRKVCIDIPTGALEKPEVFRITPGAEVPGGALSEGYDIGLANGLPLELLKPARVTFSLEIVEAGGIPNENLLRIYTRKPDEDWQPLDNAFVDRVRNVVIGETSHLSPFVVLRSDRLPDGGLPIELNDGGSRDAAVIPPPPFDGGRPDAGRPDAGRRDSGMPMPDAGAPDAGTPDAGMMMDAGTPDSGSMTMDAGTPDAGTPDAGTPDAGPPDAGPPDAGEPDAGFDAGEPDAGDPDAGADAGEPDAGDGG